MAKSDSSSNYQHDIQFEGMKPHSHYNVPLLNGADVVGMLVLYLIKNAVKAHNGEISVRSKLGQGSVFTIIFPFEDSIR